MAEMSRGGYIAYQAPGDTDCLIMASGSEVGIALRAAQVLEQEGVAVRVISVPCLERLAEQPAEVLASLMPRSVEVRLAIEAGIGLPWRPWVGDRGDVLSIEQFGYSAPAKHVFEAVGLTVERAVKALQVLLAQRAARMQ